MRDNCDTSVEVSWNQSELIGVTECVRIMVCLPSCILARSDCASSAKSIAFDDCSDVSEKIIQVTVPS